MPFDRTMAVPVAAVLLGVGVVRNRAGVPVVLLVRRQLVPVPLVL
jgi:hypothetical protein